MYNNCCIPENYIRLQINYISILKRNKKEKFVCSHIRMTNSCFY